MFGCTVKVADTEIQLTGAQTIVVWEALKKDSRSWPGKAEILQKLQEAATNYAMRG